MSIAGKPKVGDRRPAEGDTFEYWSGAEWLRDRGPDRMPSESDRAEVMREEERLP